MLVPSKRKLWYTTCQKDHANIVEVGVEYLKKSGNALGKILKFDAEVILYEVFKGRGTWLVHMSSMLSTTM